MRLLTKLLIFFLIFVIVTSIFLTKEQNDKLKGNIKNATIKFTEPIKVNAVKNFEDFKQKVKEKLGIT